jgi:hypothetical protein
MSQNTKRNEEWVRNSLKLDGEMSLLSESALPYHEKSCTANLLPNSEADIADVPYHVEKISAYEISERVQPIVICIPLQSWSFNSGDRISNLGIKIDSNFTENYKSTSLPFPKQTAISFQSFIAPPLNRTQPYIPSHTGGTTVQAYRDLQALAQKNALQLQQAPSQAVDLIERSTDRSGLVASANNQSSTRLTRYQFPDSLGTELESKGDRHSRPHLDKIFLAIACVYSLTIFYFLASKFDFQFTQLFGAQTAKLPSPENSSNADTQFVNYMQKSLQAIDRKAQIQKKQTAILAANSESKLSVERSIIPPANIPVTPTIPSWQIGAALPMGATLSTPAAPTNPTLAQVPDFTPPPPPAPKKIPAFKKTSQLPPPPPVPNYEPISTQTPETKPASPARVAASQPVAAGYTLIGLLDLGQQSAAMFETNDTTKQFWKGEVIGDTGWMLKSVSDRGVAIVRNGEVRSLSVGEKF